MSQNDVKIMYIEDDMKKIQAKTNLYLQKFGDLGVFHLFKEAAQNAIDEGVDPKCWEYLKQLKEDSKFIVKIIIRRAPFIVESFRFKINLISYSNKLIFV